MLAEKIVIHEAKPLPRKLEGEGEVEVVGTQEETKRQGPIFENKGERPHFENKGERKNPIFENKGERPTIENKGEKHVPTTTETKVERHIPTFENKGERKPRDFDITHKVAVAEEEDEGFEHVDEEGRKRGEKRASRGTPFRGRGGFIKQEGGDHHDRKPREDRAKPTEEPVPAPKKEVKVSTTISAQAANFGGWDATKLF